MSPPKEVRSVRRSFEILELMNQHNGSSVADIVQLSGLPKSTAFRLLENLCVSGYLTKSNLKGGYWLTVKVQRLSHGFEDESWIHEVVMPLLEELTAKTIYPVCLATIFGTSMIIRANTDDISDLVLDRYPPGTPIPLFMSSSGWVHLSYCGKPRQEALLNICEKSPDIAFNMARKKKLIHTRCETVRKNGYAIQRRQHTEETGRTSTLAVPVRSDRELIAALVVRYFDSAVTSEEAAERYAPLLKSYSQKIGRTVKSRKRQIS
jgi:IclR family mhp operon transcriptional activator